MSRFIGIVSAYAYAVSQGYTGTEEEYAELMASYATVAEEAAESAESASASATSASASAQTATTKASEASASAQTATTKASEASTSATQASASATSASQSASTATTKASEASASASTASTKATEASASASTASTKASEASQSASDASTAKTGAETAQGLAESAKDDAESARDLAQQYAESIDPDNIFSAYATDTASGSVASFADGANNIPLKSCVVAIEPVQSGSGDPSPDNVRPISGWIGASVVRAGKNLYNYDETKLQLVTTNTGSTRSCMRTGLFDGTYSFSGYVIDSSQVGITNINIGKFKNGIATIFDSFISPTSITQRTFTVEADEEIILMASSESIYALKNTLPLYNIQIEKRNTITEYEPYQSTTYSITFPSEAGTVYGGELDVTNGVLTVDRAFIASYNGETLPSEWISDRDKYVAGTAPTTGAQVCYKLSQAVVYTLTPTEIKSLLGDNHIWADAGDTEVIYRADPNLYIDKRIGTEAPMIATDNIVSGSYFMVGNNLYKATANIASGAAVVVGTNATAKTMAEALNEINA